MGSQKQEYLDRSYLEKLLLTRQRSDESEASDY
jgi:hypothetical protein